MVRLKQNIKRTIILLCCLLSLLLFGSCGLFGPSGFAGDTIETALWSAGVNSVLETRGHGFHDGIYIQETDGYGRVLYICTTFQPESSGRTYLLIAQKYDEEYVYYYSDFNFIFINEEASRHPDYTEEQVEALKTLNDWDKELDEAKFIKAKISTTKPKSSIKRSTVEQAAIKAGIDRSGSMPCIYLYEDAKGRHLFRITKYSPTRQYLFIINSDGTYDKDICLEMLSDQYNYQQQLADFKKKNGWQPLR